MTHNKQWWLYIVWLGIQIKRMVKCSNKLQNVTLTLFEQIFSKLFYLLRPTDEVLNRKSKCFRF